MRINSVFVVYTIHDFHPIAKINFFGNIKYRLGPYTVIDVVPVVGIFAILVGQEPEGGIFTCRYISGGFYKEFGFFKLRV